jgi:hypothetical protein
MEASLVRQRGADQVQGLVPSDIEVVLCSPQRQVEANTILRSTPHVVGVYDSPWGDRSQSRSVWAHHEMVPRAQRA